MVESGRRNDELDHQRVDALHPLGDDEGGVGQGSKLMVSRLCVSTFAVGPVGEGGRAPRVSYRHQQCRAPGEGDGGEQASTGRCACTHGTPFCPAQVDPGVHCEADTLRPNVLVLHKLGCSSPAEQETASGSCTPGQAAVGFWTAPTWTRAATRGHAAGSARGTLGEMAAHHWTARARWGSLANASRPTRRTTGARCPAEPRRPAHPEFGMGCRRCGREPRR